MPRSYQEPTTTTCDQEKIHLISSIQEGTYLLEFDARKRCVRYSENLPSIVKDNGGAILGQPLDVFFDQTVIKPVTRKEGSKNGIGYSIPQRGKSKFFDGEFIVISHYLEEHLILEFQSSQIEADIDNFVIHEFINHAIDELSTVDSFEVIVEKTAEFVKGLMGYDRVMVYQFDEHDQSGSVIAEAKTDIKSSFLGLNFPATDVPKQARELYKKNLIRGIGNVHSDPVKLLPADIDTDLSYSLARSVSPIHIQYLKNMKVTASYSISIIVNNELWGLIACHHYAGPKPLSFEVVKALETLSKVLSLLIAEQIRKESLNFKLDHFIALERIRNQMESAYALDQVLFSEDSPLFDLKIADSWVLVDQKNATRQSINDLPKNEIIEAIVDELKGNEDEEVIYSSNIQKDLQIENSADQKGFIATRMSNDEYLIGFRNEKAQSIEWAGRPQKMEVLKNGLVELTPRSSFEKFIEEISGESKKWSAKDIQLMKELKEVIIVGQRNYAVEVDRKNKELAKYQQKLEDEVSIKTQELKRYNDELIDSNTELERFIYVISHDLNEPLNTIKMYAHLMEIARGKGNLDVSAYLQEIEGSVERMAVLLKDLLEYSRMGRLNTPQLVPIGEVIKEATSDLKSLIESTDAEISFIGNLPIIKGYRVELYQVFLNLISNSIKYSKPGIPPKIVIDYKQTENDHMISVSDNGSGIDAKYREKVFDVFSRLNSNDDSGTGIGLAVVRKAINLHKGSVVIEDNSMHGTTFKIQLPK